MATYDFLPFAAAGGANVISQSTYASMAALGPGFSTGIANSNQLNKVWRQASIIASVVAQYIVNITGQNATDDGTTATLLGNLITAVQAGNYSLDSGVANAYSIGFAGTPANPLFDGALYIFKAAHANTAASTLSVSGSAARNILGQDGNALAGGEIATGSYVIVTYSAGAAAFIMAANSGGFMKAVTPAASDNSTKVATTAFMGGVQPKVIASVNSSGVIQRQAGTNSISSINHSGTGTYVVTFGTALANANYVVLVTSSGGGGFFLCNTTSKGTGGFTVQTDAASGGSLADAPFDLAVFY